MGLQSRNGDSATPSGVHPLRPRARRAAALSAVGAAVLASGLAAASPAAAADEVVLNKCSEDAESSAFGQPILASPHALDAKVHQATLLIFPLQFGRADRAQQQFLNTAPVDMGSVAETTRSFSGTDLADALAERVSGLPALEGKGDAVNWHVRNLASVGCLGGVDVAGHPKPDPETTEPPSSDSPRPPARDTHDPAPGGNPAPETPNNTPSGPTPGTAPPVDSDYTPAPAERVTPSNYSYVPGSLPPWSDTRFGDAPGRQPEVGDLLKESESRTKQRKDIREAGSAKALPSEAGDRVALPVLLAAISIAGVTSALIRTWVLRRG